uniref:Uncharacterized protein n=1 Tax=Biomphalaria glabrata TaxID=6526 RepID=A0A2C9L7S8_BIOGL
MGGKNSKPTPTRNSDQLDVINPEANPEKGKEVKVILPNGTSTLSRAYGVQTAGEFKVDCLRLHAPNAKPENIKLVIVNTELEEKTLEDHVDMEDYLSIIEHIILRSVVNPPLDSPDLRAAIHVKRNTQH